jgi:hypothetical protein
MGAHSRFFAERATRNPAEEFTGRWLTADPVPADEGHLVPSTPVRVWMCPGGGLRAAHMTSESAAGDAERCARCVEAEAAQ